MSSIEQQLRELAPGEQQLSKVSAEAAEKKQKLDLDLGIDLYHVGCRIGNKPFQAISCALALSNSKCGQRRASY